MFKKNKTEAISFREFMADEHTAKEMPRINSIYAFSGFFPMITPTSFFPIHDTDFVLFLVGAGAIVASAFFEQMAAKLGSTNIAGTIKTISGFAFPVMVYGAVLWLFFSL
jgi:hypothetical protein